MISKGIYARGLIDQINRHSFTSDEKADISKVVYEYFDKIAEQERHDKFQKIIDSVGAVIPYDEEIIDIEEFVKRQELEFERLFGWLRG